MEYGVVLCSRCRKAKVFDTRRRTTTCAGCGRTLRIADHTVHHRSPHLEEAAQAAGLLNARAAHREDEFAAAVLGAGAEKEAASAPAEPGVVAARRARAARGEGAKAEAVAQALGTFTLEEFEAALKAADVASDRAAALLERLLRNRVVYEPRPATYRTL